MNRLHANILETVGNTPIVKLNKIGPENVNIYVKVEAFKPMGSVKDRLALGVIEDAEKSGALKPGQTVIEATSGNTGIGLAMVCAQKGYPLVVTMDENFSLERRKMMRFLGARVVLTPAALKGSGMLPDTGERYLSTVLFDGVPEDMTSEETDISRSTPNFRFDMPPPAPPEHDKEEEPGSSAPAKALQFLDQATADKDNPVVLFALEWCEFSWSVRKMFAHYEIPYRSIDLDSVAYQQDDWGGGIRAAILERTGLKTIPQIYIGGEHIGGATELFDAVKDGRAQELLESSGVDWNRSATQDPYSFLPGWLHAR